MKALYPIQTEADYTAALAELEAFFDNNPDAADTETAAYFGALSDLVCAYEKKHAPIDPPDPIEAIKFRMQQNGLSVSDMQPYIGRASRVYEILNRKRPLSLSMIRRLHARLGIPADVLILP